MVNLSTVSGFSVLLDGENLAFEGVTTAEGKVDIRIEHLRGELLNPSLTCPTIFCSQYLKVDQEAKLRRAGLRCDIVVMPSNLAGIEYIKNKGHYNDLVTSKDSSPELVEVLSGGITLLLQRPRIKPTLTGHWASIVDMYDFTKLEDVIVLKLIKGDKALIPSGWGHVFINSKQVTSVFAVYRNSDEINVRRFIPEQGAGYYLIRKNARQEVVRNPRYKMVPNYMKGRSENAIKVLSIKKPTPIFKQITKNPKNFAWLSRPGMVNWNTIVSAYIG